MAMVQSEEAALHLLKTVYQLCHTRALVLFKFGDIPAQKIFDFALVPPRGKIMEAEDLMMRHMRFGDIGPDADFVDPDFVDFFVQSVDLTKAAIKRCCWREFGYTNGDLVRRMSFPVLNMNGVLREYYRTHLPHAPTCPRPFVALEWDRCEETVILFCEEKDEEWSLVAGNDCKKVKYS